jgi:hypothetical protein
MPGYELQTGEVYAKSIPLYPDLVLLFNREGTSLSTSGRLTLLYLHQPPVTREKVSPLLR